MSDIIISNKTGAPIVHGTPVLAMGNDMSKQFEYYQHMLAAAVGVPRKYLGGISMGCAVKPSYQVTQLRRPIMPYTYQPFNKVVDYLVSKEDMGLIAIDNWTLRKDRNSILFRIDRISADVWERVIKPEVKRHVQILSVKHVRAWKSVKPKRMRLLIRRNP